MFSRDYERLIVALEAAVNPKDVLLQLCSFIVMHDVTKIHFVMLLLSERVISLEEFFQTLGYDPTDISAIIFLPTEALFEIGAVCALMGLS